METNDRLSAQLTSQAELVGSLTHDLKGLLTGLEGGLYLIDSGLKKAKQDRIDQGFAMLRRNLTRTRRTIARVQYYVKEREISAQPLELREVLAEVDGELAEHAATAGVALTVTEAAGSLESDAFALSSALIDIVEYALQSCPRVQGAEPAGVSVEAAVAGGEAVFEISARGPCPSDRVLAQLQRGCYEPISGDRAHLGLFIAGKLVRQLGGALRIAPDTARGITRYAFRLPAGPTGA